jgi:hypothetical protein
MNVHSSGLRGLAFRKLLAQDDTMNLFIAGMMAVWALIVIIAFTKKDI